jgi:hypothetical protein
MTRKISYTVLKRMLKTGKPRIIVEDRVKLDYMNYGMQNHAEFKGLLNPADMDLWDVIIPGYEDAIPPGNSYITTGVYGVVEVSGGNHKVVVRIQRPGRRTENIVWRDIYRYIRNYRRKNRRHKITWTPFEDL